MRALPPPAVVVTVWDDRRLERSRPHLERLARAAAPGDLAVAVHSTDPTADAVRVVRELGARLWIALPYDPIAKAFRDDDHAAAVALARRYAERAAAHCPEVVELNGEAAWKPGGGLNAANLAALAANALAATREVVSAPLAWTSFDHLRWHSLPWRVIYGERGVELATPQVYAAPKTGVGGHVEAAKRLSSYAAQWEPLVRDGSVRPDLAPGQGGHAVYGQIHHLTAAGAARVLDASDTCRAWALPTRSDAAGLDGVEALLVARRVCGRRRGAIARFQADRGLVADGIAGPKTLAVVRETLGGGGV